MRQLGNVRRAIPKAHELRGGIGMIGVLVRDQNRIHAFGERTAKRFKAACDFAAAKTGIDEESGVLGFKQRGVARAAGGENGNPERDRKSLREGMMAKVVRRVKGKRKKKIRNGESRKRS